MVWNRLRFPNMSVTYIAPHPRQRLGPNKHVFRVSPSYTKHDVKEYLTKIYNLPVVRVNTMNYEGKFKRAPKGHYYKEKDWKKAIVTLAPEGSTMSTPVKN